MLCFWKIKNISRFCRYIIYKPSQNLTHPLGGAKGFKGLVAYAKYNRDSYDSELALVALFYFAHERANFWCWGYLFGLHTHKFYTSFYSDFAPNNC